MVDRLGERGPLKANDVTPPRVELIYAAARFGIAQLLSFIEQPLTCFVVGNVSLGACPPGFHLGDSLVFDLVELGDEIERGFSLGMVALRVEEVSPGVHPAGGKRIVGGGEFDELTLFVGTTCTPPLRVLDFSSEVKTM